jgi:hypothetical protein
MRWLNFARSRNYFNTITLSGIMAHTTFHMFDPTAWLTD